MHANYRADYEKGIAGIGVGIDYLNRSGFLDIEDDIFEDFDERMYRAVMYDAGSISDFMKAWLDMGNIGWYDRTKNRHLHWNV